VEYFLEVTIQGIQRIQRIIHRHSIKERPQAHKGVVAVRETSRATLTSNVGSINTGYMLYK